jgi:hypothetical protein
MVKFVLLVHLGITSAQAIYVSPLILFAKIMSAMAVAVLAIPAIR